MVARALGVAAALGLALAARAATVAIDVGHTQEEPGATSARGVPEFLYNARLAREIAEALARAGHRALVLGADGRGGEPAKRAARAAAADLLVSVHHDSVQPRFLEPWDYRGERLHYSDQFSGFSLFVSRANPRLAESLRCASAIGGRLRAAGFSPSRYHADPIAGEDRPFADELNGVHYFDRLAVLRNARIPALLFEAGVIVHRDEEMRLRQAGTRQRIAESVAGALGECLQ